MVNNHGFLTKNHQKTTKKLEKLIKTNDLPRFPTNCTMGSKSKTIPGMYAQAHSLQVCKLDEQRQDYLCRLHDGPDSLQMAGGQWGQKWQKTMKNMSFHENRVFEVF